MALPSSGPITMAMVAAEIGISASGLSLNDSRVRTLAGRPSGSVSFANLLGKAWAYLNGITCTSLHLGDDGYRYTLTSVDTNTSYTATAFYREQKRMEPIVRIGTNQWQAYSYSYDEAYASVTIRVTAAGKTIDWNFPRHYFQRQQSGSCFTADSLVLMADGSLRRIDEVQVGEFVRTAVGVGRVWKVHKPKLGDRPLVSFNGRCKTSAEHSLWTRTANDEYWSTRDIEQWTFEGATGQGPTSPDKPIIDLTSEQGSEVEFATVDGWHRTSWQYHDDASADTQLYNLRLDDGGSYFVDGYLVSSRFSVDNSVDWINFKWKGLTDEISRRSFSARLRYAYRLLSSKLRG